MNHPPKMLWLSYTQHLGLECGFLKDRMKFILNKPMQNYMFILELDHDIENTPLRRRLTALSLGKNEQLGAQLSLEHFNYHYTCMKLDEPMINVKIFVFHHCDGSIGMSIVQAYEEVFPST